MMIVIGQLEMFPAVYESVAPETCSKGARVANQPRTRSDTSIYIVKMTGLECNLTMTLSQANRMPSRRLEGPCMTPMHYCGIRAHENVRSHLEANGTA